jgi:3-hydroxyacyl-[acyl-carrier-protein] dehydratase
MTTDRAATTPIKLPIEIAGITAMLPHRFPFLLIDRVVAVEPSKTLRAIKNVSINEPFFQGHFPGHAVMPGVLIIEALAQASGVLTQISAVSHPGRAPLYYLVKVDNARFSKTVIPGDQLVLDVALKRMLRGMGLFACVATVDGREVASAEILCAERGRDA